MGGPSCVRDRPGEEEEEAAAWFGRREGLTSAIWQPRAKEDFAVAVAWLADRSGAASLRLIAATRAALDLLRHQPGLGRALDLATAPGVRAWSPRGFPSWLLVYRALPRVGRGPTGIVVLRFVHAARDLPFHLADGSLGPSPFFQ